MPASEDRAISDFPIALQLTNRALVLLSAPDGLGGYDSVHAELTEIGRIVLETQYTQDLGNMDVFTAIKNCRVLSGTTTPTSAQGADGQMYVKYQTVSNVDEVVGLYVKLNGEWVEISTGGSGGDVGIECTQAQYDAWEQAGTLLEDTNYYITDGQSGGGVVIDDTTASSNTVYSSDKVEDLLGDKQDATDNSLATTDKTIIGAINEQQSVIGYSYDEYDATTAYSTGDLCIYNNVLYKAKQATTGNLPTNTTYWEQTSIADEIGRIDTASKFRIGDTITASIYKHCAGRLTNAGDKVLFFYPLEKPVDSANVTDALLTFSANGLCYTANGGFGLVSGSYAGTITDGGIYFIIDLTQAQSSIGARPATVEFQSRTITFR